ncbi:CHAT domain-containing protein [Azospirillum brasilense]|uniref:CHAT domain-containing protein n=1 Tax=Azospirillum brasilense TaxID=192 RepID=UPI00157B46C5|nr:CHAT domain-containing protein [Azospirillum brasilense]
MADFIPEPAQLDRPMRKSRRQSSLATCAAWLACVLIAGLGSAGIAGTPAEEKVLADSYLRGVGVERDERAAAMHLRAAADAGDAEAAENLAFLLAKGPEASASSVATAQAELAEIIEELQKSPDQADFASLPLRMQAANRVIMSSPDPQAAVRYYQQAITGGRVLAPRLLASMFLKANGVPRDLAETRRLFALGAQRGDATAAHLLGVMAEFGLGGPHDRNLAREAQRQAMDGGEPRGIFASATFEIGAAMEGVLPQKEATAAALERPPLRPSLSASGRRMVVAEPVRITVVDALGRRRFAGTLPRGSVLPLAPDDAAVNVEALVLDGRGNNAVLARLEQGTEITELRGRYQAERVFLSGGLDKPGWSIEATQGGAGAFQLFSSDGALSLPSSFAPLAEPKDEGNAAEAAAQADLWLDVRPGGGVLVRPPVGAPWRVTAPEGVVFRVRLIEGIAPVQAAKHFDPTALPSELVGNLDSGVPAFHDAAGGAVGWAFQADDHRLSGVVFPDEMNVAAAALQAGMRGDLTAALRAARVWRRLAVHRSGPMSEGAITAGMFFAALLSASGQIAEAQTEADHWVTAATALYGPGNARAVEAAVMLAGHEVAAGRLSVAAAAIGRALAAADIFSPVVGTIRIGESTATFETGVSPNYWTAVRFLRGVYAAAGETEREAAMARRLLLLESLDDPAGSGNGSLDVLLDVARSLKETSPAAAAMAAERARQRAKADAGLRDVSEPIRAPLPPVAEWFRTVFGDPDTSLMYARALLLLGHSDNALGRAEEAGIVLERALTIVDRAADPADPLRADVLGALAESSSLRGQSATALRYAREAASAALIVRHQAVAESDAATLSAGAAEAVERLLGLLSAQAAEVGGAEVANEAFPLIVQSLRDDLGGAARRAALPAAAQLAAQLSGARRAMEAGLRAGDDANVALRRIEATRLAAELQRLMPPPQASSWADVRAALGPERGIVLAWPGRTRAFVLAAGPAGTLLAEVPGGATALRKATTAFRGALTDRNTDFDDEIGEALYRLLIAPVSSVLGEVQQLLVVTDGPLRSVPFEAMRNQKGWLGDQMAITYLPSVAILTAPVGKRTAGAVERPRAPFFGIGPPVIQKAVSAADPLAGLEELTFAPAALRTLAATTGGGKDSLLQGADATKARVMGHPLLAQAHVLAFATHGLVADQRVDALGLPSLLLTGTGLAERVLTAADIEAARVGAALVILLACNTASPDGSLGSPGLSGLSRAFIAAGAGAVMATHWRVREDVAARFAETVIRRWQEGYPLVQAKRLAQQDLRKEASGAYVHPAWWAAFVLLGDGNAGWREP